MNRLLQITMAALLTAIAVPAAAQEFRPRPPRGPGGHGLMHQLRSLDLAPAQHEAIRGLMDEFRPRLDAAHEAICDSDRELRSVERQSGFDAPVLAPLAQAKGEKVAERAAVDRVVSVGVRRKGHEEGDVARDPGVDASGRPGAVAAAAGTDRESDHRGETVARQGPFLGRAALERQHGRLR